MGFSDQTTLGQGDHVNVYIKGLGDKPANPFFEVRHKDGNITQHKKIEDAKFISISSHLYTTEAFGEKKQAKILFESDGETYQLAANLTLPMQSIVNCFLGALKEGPINTFSIVLDVKEIGAKVFGQSKTLINGKMPSRAYSKDELETMAKVKGVTVEDIFTQLLDAQDEVEPERDLQAELEAEEVVSKKPTKKAKEVVVEDDGSELPF